MSKSFKFVAVFAALLLSFAAPRAEAGPISGSFSIVGNFIPVDTSGNAIDLGDAVGLDFINIAGDALTPGLPGLFYVTQGKGDFSSLTGQLGLMQDLTFAGTTNLPLEWFQSVGFVTFDLLTVTATLQTDDFLNLVGTGLFHKAGYDDTAGIFKLSANAADGTFSFSASESTTVPEPATLMLVGTGLAMGVRQLRRRKASQVVG